MKRGDRWLVVAAVVGAALFFTNLYRLWPLVDFTCFISPQTWRPIAEEVLAREHVAIPDSSAAQQFWCDDPALTYLERAFGRAKTQELIRSGSPVVAHRIIFKAPGIADNVQVLISNGHVIGWDRSLQDDAPGAHLDGSAAEQLARAALASLYGDPASFTVMQRSTHELPLRRDHHLTFERVRIQDPELRERLEIVVAGEVVSTCMPSVVVPAAAQRDARERSAPINGLQVLAEAGLALGGLGALSVFLRRLKAGGAQLKQPAVWALVTWILLLIVNVLQQARLFERWDPLWPMWLAYGYRLLAWSLDNLETILPMFVFLAAADAIDSAHTGGRRGATLWRLGRGDWRDPGVVQASLRGFAVGCLCGGVLTIGVLLLELLAGARVALQPRDFFFYPLNSAVPVLTTLCFFAHIALFEELGYRYFAGSWLEQLTGSRVWAVAIPAVVYGAMHTIYAFLPPQDPFWARPLLLMLVGCVWGWAFFRYDALTVVLSHLTCDLFIFNWPALASRQPLLIASAAAVILVPLLPGVLGLIWPRRGPPAERAPGPQVATTGS